MEDRSGFSVRPYRPAWWLPGGHLQTLGGWLLRPRGGVGYRRERIDTPDGDFLDLDFAEVGGLDWDALVPGAPLAVVLHGLEGSARSLPAQQIFRALAAERIRGVGINFRSCSGEPNRAARSYHAGETTDLALVLDLLAERFRRSPLVAVGYSLGGNVLLKYLGERGDVAAERLRAAAAISVPFDLAAGAGKLERGLSRLYGAHFLRSLRRKYAGKREVLATHCDQRRAVAARSLRDFDDAVTAPVHGFRDAVHYYETASSGRYLSRIRLPTLLMHALDDPFLPAAAVPLRAAEENPYLHTHFSARGGHVGFIGGRRPWAPDFWAEREAARFLRRQLDRASRVAALLDAEEIHAG